MSLLLMERICKFPLKLQRGEGWSEGEGGRSENRNEKCCFPESVPIHLK